jgi:photosystem II stability/assembly factor-like uncharacterized protein
MAVEDTRPVAADADPSLAATSSRRRLRGLGLSGLALVAIAAVGITYLHPTLPRLTGASVPAAEPTTPDPRLLSATDQDFLIYDFVSPSVGWALDIQQAKGSFWVFRTVDGAKHWQRQLFRTADLGIAPEIKFFDTKHGIVTTGNPTRIYRTSDGGSSWSQVLLPSGQYSSLQFTDPRHGWYLYGTPTPDSIDLTLRATDDGGDTWRDVSQLPHDAYFVTFRNLSEAWSGSMDRAAPRVYVSRDGGLTWVPRDLPLPPGVDPAAAQFCSASEVVLLPGQAVLAQFGCKPFSARFSSVDMGATWTYVPPSSVNSGGSARVTYLDAKHWWAMQGGDLFKTSNGGQTWTHVALQLDDWEYIPHALDSRHAWAQLLLVGPLPSDKTKRLSGLAMTSDGGVTWTRVTVPHP